MKRLLVIVLMILPLGLRAQWDTTGFHASLCENVTMTSVSVGLIGTGLLAAFQPDVNSWTR